MRDIASDSAIGSNHKSLVVSYSTECSVKDKGRTCLFCVLNGTKGLDDGEVRLAWKYPHQIAETVKTAYQDEGYTHLTITGGFVPERREVEYYLDVAENIKVALGTNTFNGIACIGAPLEGHRSPTVDWHWDAQLKHANILKKYGRTYDEIFNATPARTFAHDIYQIENETLPIFKRK